MPTATTDSPIAISTTRPCRSTKCAGAIANPVIPRIVGVSHSNRPAAAQRTYCAVPPSAPPATTTSAADMFHGASRRIACVTVAEAARLKKVVCTTTTTR